MTENPHSVRKSPTEYTLFVTTLQGYPDMLSCDLNKHVYWLYDHVIIESHENHRNALVLMKSLDHFDL